MTSYMTIMVRVISARAQAALQSVRRSTDQVTAATARANAVPPIGGARHLAPLMKFGNQLQWTGRMIQYNFTLPLVLAGAAATKWALENEKAMKHVEKVYGDTGEAAAQFRKENEKLTQQMAEQKATRIFAGELNALDDAFTAISNHYGVAKKEVLEVAGAWAAAGASGVALARSVDATMQAIIIGDMEATQATEALISIQAQYNLSTKELMQTLAVLNSVENSTAIGMEGLIQGFQRAAGVARTAGVDVNQLAAMLAALVPATGSAANAGNALKTIISRLMAPTKEASQVMNEMGLETTAFAWQSATATERLKIMAKEFNTLSDAEKNAASSVIASRWQINKFSILMEELVSTTGNYAKALNSADDAGENFKRMQKELNTVLESDPRKLQRMWVMLQNASAEIIQPLIPYIIYLAGAVADLAKAFAKLDPELQKLILFGLAFLAMVGPVIRYVGALTTLFYVLAFSVHQVLRGFGSFAKILFSPIKGIFNLIRWLGTLYATMISGGGAAIVSFGRVVLTPFGQILLLMRKMVVLQGLGGLFGLMWAGVVGVFKVGSSAAFAVLTAFNTASVASDAAASRERVALATGTAIARAKAEQAGAGAAAAANAAGNAATVSSDLVTVSQRQAMWAAFIAWRVGQARAWNAAVWGIEAGAQASMLALETTSYGLRRTAWTTFHAWLLVQLRAFWVAHNAIEASGHAAAFAIENGALAARQAAWQAFIAWRIAMARAYNVATFGLDSAAATGALAIEAAKNTTIVGMTATTGTVVVRQHAAIGAAVVATHATAATATVSIWARARAALFAIFLSLGAGLVKILLGLFASIGAMTGTLIAAIVSPWGVAFLAVVGLAYAFRDQLGQIWNNIKSMFQSANVVGMFESLGDQILRVFYMLPEGVQGAMIAVVTVIRDAALAVYEWFQYINPFAHHSPSLVENVENGVNRIIDKFGEFYKVGDAVGAAYAEIKRFGQATAGLDISAAGQEKKEDRKAIKKAGGGGAALASFERLHALLGVLEPQLKRVEARMAAQQAVVDRWAQKLDEANAELDKQTDKLDRLQAKLDKYQEKLDEANDRLQAFASAPLVGMREMEDQIFANEMAQKRLQLAMMDMEDVVGTYDQLQEKMAAINGLQEIMRGTQASLRSAGAGSEILSQYDSEIAKLEEQKGTYQDTFEKLNVMRLELERLQREAERMDLVKALKFDELQRAIDQAVDTTEELTFDEIMAGIRTAQLDVAKYTEKVAEATAAVREQEGVVAQAAAERDRIQARLDQEEITLGKIKDRYDAIKDAISAINSAISDVVANADKMNEALKAKKDAKGAEEYVSPGLANFRAGKGANFPDPGGSGIPPRADWSSQEDAIKKFTERMGERTAKMFENVNPFKSLKEKAKEAWDWIKDKAGVAADKISEIFGKAFEGVNLGDAIDSKSIKDKLEPIGAFITEVLRDIGGWVESFWKLVKPPLEKIWEEIKKGVEKLWNEVGPELEEFKELWGPAGQAIENAWKAAKPLLAILGAGISAAISVILWTIAALIEPLFDFIGGIVTGIIDVVKGLIKILISIFNADFGMFIDGVSDLFGGLWEIIASSFKLGIDIVVGIVVGFVEGIWNWMKWLYDELVGHSIIPDIINGIIDWFHKIGDIPQWVYDNMIKPVFDFFVDLYNDVTDKLGSWWEGIKTAWNNIKTNITTWWSNNVWNPIANGVTSWWAERKLVWAGWWQDLKDAWNNITSNIKTWWSNNIWNPIANGVSEWWAERLVVWGGWWGQIKDAWSNITTNMGTWWTNNFATPIWNKVTGIFTDIKKWFTDSPNMLFDAMKPIINGVLRGVNTIIKGLNKVSDVLPGDLWNIQEIDTLAAGGRMKTRTANRGFMTNGARAIVGEGKANYPEFVIPTDPTHRNRARSLLAMAAQKVGAGRTASGIRNAQMVDSHGVPMFDVGGWLGDKWDDTKNLGKKIANLPKKAVGAVMDKALDAAWDAVNKVGYQPVESPPEFAISKLRGWVDEMDGAIAKKLDSMVPMGGNVPVGAVTNAGGTSSWKGGIFTNKFIAHMEKAEELAGSSVGVMQGGFRPATSYSGTSHQADAVDFQVNNALITAFRRVGIAAGDRTGLGNWAPHSHAIPGPSAGLAGGSAIYQWADYMMKGGMNQGLRSPWGLAHGAIVKKSRGGTNVTIGEGSHDEGVFPLPHDWKRNGLGGGKTYYIKIERVEFPNITDPNDAELFIQNIENLARD